MQCRESADGAQGKQQEREEPIADSRYFPGKVDLASTVAKCPEVPTSVTGTDLLGRHAMCPCAPLPYTLPQLVFRLSSSAAQ
mmetsp:Transcript_9999/g.29997  ORF Transcript_9999/g.29997 Transcript_9999/m.29997 type:complete len:82 (+) Transcript_9999:82-327(+)